MSTTPIVIIISNPPPRRGSKEKMTPFEVQVLYIEGEPPANTLRRAADQLDSGL